MVGLCGLATGDGGLLPTGSELFIDSGWTLDLNGFSLTTNTRLIPARARQADDATIHERRPGIGQLIRALDRATSAGAQMGSLGLK